MNLLLLWRLQQLTKVDSIVILSESVNIFISTPPVPQYFPMPYKSNHGEICTMACKAPISQSPGKLLTKLLQPTIQIFLDFPILVSEAKEFIAFDSIEACSLWDFGIAAAEDAKEKPDPSRSMNIVLANWVARLALSVSEDSGVRDLGPMPATFMYWAERPGVPTAIIKGLLLRLSATVSPSMPQKVKNSFSLPTAMLPVNMRFLVVTPVMGLTTTAEWAERTSRVNVI